ncbi:MAG: UvrD-helicase domain-containing protein [Candidatus Woesearchaeota archaeon]
MDDLSYVHVLEAVNDLPFSVGKNTLIDVLVGSTNKKMVSNDAYLECVAYNSLFGVDKARIDSLIRELIRAGCLQYVSSMQNPRWKTLSLTSKGVSELANPSLITSSPVSTHSSSSPTKHELLLMQEHEEFLSSFTQQQRHAIVSCGKRVLCVAGAGSGKTTVLTNRIRFLTQKRGVLAKNVLAITFTRKAREEMQTRLGGVHAQIVTFNGFCERVLRAHGLNKPLVSYGQKIMLFREACKRKGLEILALIHEYYTSSQRNGKSSDELARRLMSDVFSILDHYANEDETVASSGRSVLASTLLALAKEIIVLMDERGVMDYSGQVQAVLALFRSRPEVVPSFDHVLVDEYQDVNVSQVRLLELLAPSNLFVVGDPRQSIFGWRGSHVEFINDFEGDCVVQLTKNFRSCKEVVSVMNKCISSMKLPPLKPGLSLSGAVQVMSYSSDSEELRGVAGLLKHVNGSSVFVLARTNKQLEELSVVLDREGVSYSIRQETSSEDVSSGIVLSTVHAIKGLEAETVVVIGCTSRYFPCRVSDHPVVELITGVSLREEEELRLLYVALSRAQKSLIVTYSGSLTYLLDGVFSSSASRDDEAYASLKKWRSEVAAQKSLPAYCVFSDKTLRELATRKPSSLAELEAIHGIGPSKRVEFGEAVLEVLGS